jgi:hypothetical protein
MTPSSFIQMTQSLFVQMITMSSSSQMSTLNAKNAKENVIQPDEKTKVTYFIIQEYSMTVNIQGDTLLSAGR